jgi:hypothetical protein
VLFLTLDRTVQIFYQESASTIVGIALKIPHLGPPAFLLAISTALPYPLELLPVLM